jgi:hypothetical protein
MKTVLYALLLFCTSTLYGVDHLYTGDESSSDFVIRWLFQDYCDHVFDPRTDIYVWPTNKQQGVTFNPEDVKPADIVFARDAELFFKTLHLQIPHPYIMVTHGEHLDAMQKNCAQYLDDPKLIAWFGIHPCKAAMQHPKYRPLPLGVIQQPDNYKKRSQLNDLFKKLRTTEKTEMLYMNFADFNKPERKKVRALFIDKPFCKRDERLPFINYLKEMATFKFALSPKGLGPDCYRTWEALLVGCIPIVRSCSLDPLYQGLPVLIVEQWEDITEEFLQRKYEEITSKKYDIARLYMDYWLAQIESERQSYLNAHKP